VWSPGWHVEHVDVTGSTNVDLIAAAAERPDRSVLVAARQTAGRGRLDRRWEAPPGANLLASLLFHHVTTSAHELTVRVGLAAIDAVAEVADVAATLKWPNDVLVGPSKLAGILAQQAQSQSIVVGIGLNVGWAPEGAARLGDGIAPSTVLAALLRSFDALPVDIAPRHRAALATLGRRVRVELADRVLVGHADDIDADGRLLVRDERGVTHRIDAGDVVHLR